LPLLTCIGDTFVGRVAASLLKAIGLPELITTDMEAYEGLAIDLATSPDMVSGHKGKACGQSPDNAAVRYKTFHPTYRSRLHRHACAAPGGVAAGSYCHSMTQ
jgi:hypothetical protein